MRLISRGIGPNIVREVEMADGANDEDGGANRAPIENRERGPLPRVTARKPAILLTAQFLSFDSRRGHHRQALTACLERVLPSGRNSFPHFFPHCLRFGEPRLDVLGR